MEEFAKRYHLGKPVAMSYFMAERPGARRGSLAKTGSSKPVAKKGAAVKKKFVQSSDEEKPAKKAKARQVVGSGDDDSDFDVENIVSKPRATGNHCGKGEFLDRLILSGQS